MGKTGRSAGLAETRGLSSRHATRLSEEKRRPEVARASRRPASASGPTFRAEPACENMFYVHPSSHHTRLAGTTTSRHGFAIRTAR